MFLQIRIKSVGEVAKLVLGCRNQPQCDGTTPVEINLEEVEIEGELKDNKLMLTDTVGVTLRVPNYNDIQELLVKIYLVTLVYKTYLKLSVIQLNLYLMIQKYIIGEISLRKKSIHS